MVERWRRWRAERRRVRALRRVRRLFEEWTGRSLDLSDEEIEAGLVGLASSMRSVGLTVEEASVAVGAALSRAGLSCAEAVATLPDTIAEATERVMGRARDDLVRHGVFLAHRRCGRGCGREARMGSRYCGVCGRYQG